MMIIHKSKQVGNIFNWKWVCEMVSQSRAQLVEPVHSTDHSHQDVSPWRSANLWMFFCIILCKQGSF